ncbi:MAG: hypothetical protein GKR93_10065 [Gammaproteobacteria bacterium]|nr:hypothetical protein [Gammaproteobacteria bacterium]
MEEPGKLQLKPKGRRPYFFEDPAVDKLLAMVSALAGEVSVVHDEYDTLVRVLEEKGVVDSKELKAFIPDASVRAERDQWRGIFLENVLRILHQEIEGIQKEHDENYEAAIDYAENN